MVSGGHIVRLQMEAVYYLFVTLLCQDMLGYNDLPEKGPTKGYVCR